MVVTGVYMCCTDRPDVLCQFENVKWLCGFYFITVYKNNVYGYLGHLSGLDSIKHP